MKKIEKENWTKIRFDNFRQRLTENRNLFSFFLLPVVLFYLIADYKVGKLYVSIAFVLIAVVFASMSSFFVDALFVDIRTNKIVYSPQQSKFLLMYAFLDQLIFTVIYILVINMGDFESGTFIKMWELLFVNLYVSIMLGLIIIKTFVLIVGFNIRNIRTFWLLNCIVMILYSFAIFNGIVVLS